MKRQAKLEIFPFKDGRQWGYRLRGANGRVLHVSEGYTRQRSAKRAAMRARWLMQSAPIVEQGRAKKSAARVAAG